MPLLEQGSHVLLVVLPLQVETVEMEIWSNRPFYWNTSLWILGEHHHHDAAAVLHLVGPLLLQICCPYFRPQDVS